jgi:glycosyltransferase involved in cell wall biosynthesis
MRMMKFVPIPDDKFFLTRNGIPDLGITTWKGNPHRMCYVSSPDRGLMYLLKHWKEVKEAVPDAELHIYYGFEIYDYIHRNNPAKIAFKKKIMALMDQEGITYHGRVGHKELAEEINKCGIWAYPTDFTEISCISAMKAQAVGAVPVVTNFAALQETVRNGSSG